MDLLPNRRVLTFHGIGRPGRPVDPGEGPYWVEPKAFSKIVESAARDRRVEITFDDGNASDVEIACPVLVQAGLAATFFVLAGRIGELGSVTAANLASMVGQGMQIGSHGANHVDWTRMPDAAMQVELHDARARIEDAAGVRVEDISIPFGAFDARVLRLLKEAGYRSVHSSSGGWAYAGAWFVPRTSIRADSPDGVMDRAGSSIAPRAISAMRQLARHAKYRFT